MTHDLDALLAHAEAVRKNIAAKATGYAWNKQLNGDAIVSVFPHRDFVSRAPHEASSVTVVDTIHHDILMELLPQLADALRASRVMTEFVRELASGEFATPFKRDELERAVAHNEGIRERAAEVVAQLDNPLATADAARGGGA